MVCKADEKIKNICLKITEKINKDLKSVVFSFNGNVISKSDYKKPISKFISNLDEDLVITVDNVSKTTVVEDSIEANFFFQSEFIKKSCKLTDKVSDIAKSFVDQSGLIFENLSFYYKNQKIDPSQPFQEIVKDQNVNTVIIEIVAGENEDESFFQKNKLKIIIIGVILLILIIAVVLLAVLLTKKNKKKKKRRKRRQKNRARNKRQLQ